MCDGGSRRNGPGQADTDKQDQLATLRFTELSGPDTQARPGRKAERMRPSRPTRETSRRICLQVLPPYLLAGLAMMAAGVLLDRAQVREPDSPK